MNDVHLLFELLQVILHARKLRTRRVRTHHEALLNLRLQLAVQLAVQLSQSGPFRDTRSLNFQRLVLGFIKTDRCE